MAKTSRGKAGSPAECWRWWSQCHQLLLLRLLRVYLPPARQHMRLLYIGHDITTALTSLKPWGEVVSLLADTHAQATRQVRKTLRTRTEDPYLSGRLIEGKFPNCVPFSNRSFDVIILTDVLEWLPKTEVPNGLRRAAELLRAGGVCLAGVPAAHSMNLQWRDQATQPYFFRQEEVCRLFETAGLRVLLVSHCNTFTAPLMIMNKLMGFVPAPDAPGTLPAVLKTSLAALSAVESSLLPWLPLPWGLSLAVVACVGESITLPRAVQKAGSIAIAPAEGQFA